MTGWLLHNLLWASAAMLLVLAVRRPVAHFFGASVAYALWLIPAFRLIAPPSDWLAGMVPAAMPTLPELPMLVELGDAASTGAAGGGPGPATLLLVLWGLGILVFLAFQAVAYRRFLERLSLSLASAGSHRGVPLLSSAAVDGPLALGLLDRRIVVPAHFEDRYTSEERRLALDHEHHHHRRGDIFANHLALLVLALNWFNPIAWAAFRAFRIDQELSCDAALTARAAADVRSQYAHALVKSVSAPGLVAACPLNSVGQLKRRLQMIGRHRVGMGRRCAGLALAAVLGAASLLAGGPVQAGYEGADGGRVAFIASNGADGGRDGADDAPVRQRLIAVSGAAADGRARVAGRACPGRREVVDDPDGRTRLVMCVSDGTAASRSAVLQRARERLANQAVTDASASERLVAAIDREVARSAGR